MTLEWIQSTAQKARQSFPLLKTQQIVLRGARIRIYARDINAKVVAAGNGVSKSKLKSDIYQKLASFLS